MQTGPADGTNLSFTPREWQVVKLTEQGLSNKEMACELNIALGTLKIHLDNIFRKGSVQNRVGLHEPTIE